MGLSNQFIDNYSIDRYLKAIRSGQHDRKDNIHVFDMGCGKGRRLDHWFLVHSNDFRWRSIKMGYWSRKIRHIFWLVQSSLTYLSKCNCIILQIWLRTQLKYVNSVIMIVVIEFLTRQNSFQWIALQFVHRSFCMNTSLYL